MGVKTVNTAAEMTGLGHGAVVVLGPQAKLEDGTPAPLALEKVGENWFAIGVSGTVNLEVLGADGFSWPAWVVYEP